MINQYVKNIYYNQNTLIKVILSDKNSNNLIKKYNILRKKTFMEITFEVNLNHNVL